MDKRYKPERFKEQQQILLNVFERLDWVPTPVTDLMEYTGFTNHTVKTRLAEMVDLGILTKERVSIRPKQRGGYVDKYKRTVLGGLK